MNTLRALSLVLLGAVWLTIVLESACGADDRGGVIRDDFEDGAFNRRGQWREVLVYGGRNPDTIQFEQNAGSLTIEYLTNGGDGQGTVVARTDVSLKAGQWVKVDVALPVAEPRSLVRVGLGLISDQERSADMGPGQRANSIGWGLRNDGLARGHFYGPEGEETGDTSEAEFMHIQNYAAGQFVTFLIRRTKNSVYDLYFAAAGNDWTSGGTTTFLSDDNLPHVPGIFLDAGAARHISIVDNFEVGSMWPPPPPATRTPAPRMDLPKWPRSPYELALVLPDDLDKLPKLQGTRHIVNMPAGRDDFPDVHPPAPPSAPGGYEKWTFHHGAEIAAFKDRLFLAWHSTEESEASANMRAFLSWSDDGEAWHRPIDLAASIEGSDEAYLQGFLRRYGRSRDGTNFRFDIAPRNFHIAGERLYLWTLASVNGSGDGRVFFTDNGDAWHEIPYAELDRLEAEGLTIRNNGSNRGFAALADGRLLAGHLGPLRSDGLRLCAPTTRDPTGLSGWEGGWIDTSRCADVGEPGVFQGRDGALHLTIRYGPRIWHAYSLNGGDTWSALQSQPYFSDNPANKKFGCLPDGKIFYVGTPVGPERRPLVLGISEDGWTFNQNYLVRWEPTHTMWPHPKKNDERPGYEYPTAVYRDGWLYVAYSYTRDYIEVTKIDLSQIHPAAFRVE